MDEEKVFNDLLTALRELVSIVEIHQKATNCNFAWAELQHAKMVIEEIEL